MRTMDKGGFSEWTMPNKRSSECLRLLFRCGRFFIYFIKKKRYLCKLKLFILLKNLPGKCALLTRHNSSSNIRCPLCAIEIKNDLEVYLLYFHCPFGLTNYFFRKKCWEIKTIWQVKKNFQRKSKRRHARIRCICGCL